MVHRIKEGVNDEKRTKDLSVRQMRESGRYDGEYRNHNYMLRRTYDRTYTKHSGRV